MSENENQEQLELASGTVINGYRIERELGRGAMAIVYLATQLDLQRPVAFKMLTSDLASDEEFVKRFFNEARAAATLCHPNIIQALDAGKTESGIYYFCMEYVDGETLLDIIKREGRISPEKCMKWFSEIADALNYGWGLHKFTHGDIKPENIMINKQGQAKLADFGLAKVDGHDYSGNVVMLTPLYAPPEMIRGEKFVDECRPDIYAFGASLYHALAGSAPYPGTDAQEVINRHLTETLEPLKHRNPEVSSKWSDFVSTMLVKEMSGRLSSWQAVLDGFAMLEKSSSDAQQKHVIKHDKHKPPLPLMPVRPVKSKNQTVITVSIIVLAFVLIGLLSIVLIRSQSGKTPQVAPEPVVVVASPAVESKDGATVAASVAAKPAASEVAPAVPVVLEKKSATVGEVKEEEEDDSEVSEKDSGEQAKDDSAKEEVAGEKSSESEQAAVEQTELPEGALDRTQYCRALTLSDEQRAFLSRLDIAFIWLDMSRPEAQLSGVNEHLGRLKELASGPEGDESSDCARFLLKTVLPSFEKLPMVLNSDSKRASEISLTVRNQKIRIVKFLSNRPKYALVEWTGRGTRVQRLEKHVDLHKHGVLSGVCRSLVTGGAKDIAKDSSYLAYFALSGKGAILTQLLKEYPDSAAKAMWERLVSYEELRSGMGNERRAYALWKQIERGCLTGGLESVRHSFAELTHKYSKTAVYQKVSSILVELAKGLTPVETVRELVSGVENGISSEENGVVDGMRRLLTWQARFGAGMSSDEEKQFERCFRDVLDKWEYKGPKDELTSPIYALGTVVDLPRYDAVHVAYCVEKFMKDSRSDSKWQKIRLKLIPFLRTLARLEMGDWKYALADHKHLAWKELERKEIKEINTYLELFGFSSFYSRMLLLQRFRDNYERSDKLLEQLLEYPKEGSVFYGHALAAGLEYWLLGRRGPYELDELPKCLFGEDVRKRLASVTAGYHLMKKRVFLQQLTILLESGHREEALSLLKETQHDSKVEALFTLASPPACAKMRDDLLELLENADEGTSLEIRNPYSPLFSHFNRARLAALGVRVLSEENDSASMRRIGSYQNMGSHLAGDMIFDWLLRRIGYELSLCDYASAMKLMDWALSELNHCMYPYYARLLCLRAGIMQLGGLPGGVQDAEVLIGASSVSSKSEKHMIGAAANPSKRGEYKPAEEKRHGTHFWYAWLLATERLGAEGADKEAMGDLERAGRQAGLAERSLLQGLTICLSKRRENVKAAKDGDAPKEVAADNGAGDKVDEADNGKKQAGNAEEDKAAKPVQGADGEEEEE